MSHFLNDWEMFWLLRGRVVVCLTPPHWIWKLCRRGALPGRVAAKRCNDLNLLPPQRSHLAVEH